MLKSSGGHDINANMLASLSVQYRLDAKLMQQFLEKTLTNLLGHCRWFLNILDALLLYWMKNLGNRSV
jgi:hypothetical protein